MTNRQMHISSDAAFKTKQRMVMNDLNIKDNGNRRFDMDRREFSYTAYLPERRSGIDRRGVSDNSNIQNYESISDLEN